MSLTHRCEVSQEQQAQARIAEPACTPCSRGADSHEDLAVVRFRVCCCLTAAAAAARVWAAVCAVSAVVNIAHSSSWLSPVHAVHDSWERRCLRPGALLIESIMFISA